MTPIIHAENLSKSYGGLTVLDRVSLSISPGEIVAIVGPSGAGKTTLLQILGTLSTPDIDSTTRLEIQQTDTLGLDTRQLAEFRNRSIGFIFQFHELLDEFSALENVMMPALIHGKKQKEVESRALDLLTLLGVEQRKDHKPAALSGGEQQRVAVARALMNSPQLIFADEPSGNLDSQNAAQLHQLFFDLRDQLNQTFVIVTHNKELAKMADRTIELVDGKII